MKTQIKQYAGVLLAATVVIGGIASAAITPIPTISNTFAVAGQVIKSADINKLAEALNILDARTNGTAPTDPNHLADKEYVDAAVAAGVNNPWIEVPLTDTNYFDEDCEYKWDATASGLTLKADKINSYNIRFVHYGHRSTVITHDAKSVAVEWHELENGTPGAMHGTNDQNYQPSKIFKRCN